MNEEILAMDNLYPSAFKAYAAVRKLIVFEGFRYLIAGIIITTFVFKLVGVYKEMVSEGKGFDAKHFYELGREYIFAVAVTLFIPILFPQLEKIMSVAAQAMTNSLVKDGFYNHDSVMFEPCKAILDKSLNQSFTSVVLTSIDHLIEGILTMGVSSFMAKLYDYITLMFICTRYLSLLLLEMVSPIAIALYYNQDTRSSFYTWIKSLFSTYMLYPGYVLGSVFSDLVVKNYIADDRMYGLIVIFFGLFLKFQMLKTVRSVVHRWI